MAMFICSEVSMLWTVRFLGNRRALKSLVIGLRNIISLPSRRTCAAALLATHLSTFHSVFCQLTHMIWHPQSTDVTKDIRFPFMPLLRCPSHCPEPGSRAAKNWPFPYRPSMQGRFLCWFTGKSVSQSFLP